MMISTVEVGIGAVVVMVVILLIAAKAVISHIKTNWGK